MHHAAVVALGARAVRAKQGRREAGTEADWWDSAGAQKPDSGF